MTFWACMFQVPTVAELEGAMHQLLRQRACRLVQRRQDDIKDESAEFASLSSQSILKVFIIYLNGLVGSLSVCVVVVVCVCEKLPPPPTLIFLKC